MKYSNDLLKVMAEDVLAYLGQTHYLLDGEPEQIIDSPLRDKAQRLVISLALATGLHPDGVISKLKEYAET